MKGSVGSRWWVRCLVVLCPLLSGCFPLLYAYPSLSVVPPIEAGPVPDKIYAFRVDVTDEQNGAEFPDHDCYVFREIQLSGTSRIPSQVKIDLDRGWMFYGPVKYSAHTHNAVCVRLYRPGWQTVEVARPEAARHLSWVKAEGTRAREKAVDDLLSTWKTDSSGQAEYYRKIRSGDGTPRQPEDTTLFRCLAPGSAGGQHRWLLLFAADEYQRIPDPEMMSSESPPADPHDYDRRMAKVHWLHNRANE